MLLTTIVYESFKDYVAVEMLEGENKYDAEKYGLQVSVRFTCWNPLSCIVYIGSKEGCDFYQVSSSVALAFDEVPI